MRYHGLLDDKRADSTMPIKMNLGCSVVRSQSSTAARQN